MEDCSDIPGPFKFSPFKHHLGYLTGILGSTRPEEVAGRLELICNNYVDLYTGHLTVTEICSSLAGQLKSGHNFSPEEFSGWLARSVGYRKLVLADRSEWIVRLGEDPERYVHIHPSREGAYTIRTKGATLKTICMIRVMFPGCWYPGCRCD